MPLPEYTVLTVIAIGAVILAELLWLRSGVFRRPAYWGAIVICLAFQVPVDGWLTKLSDPIVIYDPDQHLGVRFPWDIPIEDFGFGWAMLTLVIMVWILAGRPADEPDGDFDRAADRYDQLARLNPGYHRTLRRAAAELISRLREPQEELSDVGDIHVDVDAGEDDGDHGGREERQELVLWDLGCGSGISTQALLSAAEDAGEAEGVRVIGVDASAGMLAQTSRKSWPEGVSFVNAPAQLLPSVSVETLERPADGAFAAYLLRNVPEAERDEVIAGIRDQIRPGGWLALQDYHVRGSGRATTVWTLVCWGIVVPLATLMRGHPAIYRYLWRSVMDNYSTEELESRLRDAGLTDIQWLGAGGWQRGILHTVFARRPYEGELS